MDLSERLSSLRNTAKATLNQVSTGCGCSPQYLHKLEKGALKRPKISLLYKLAAYYQFSSDILILEAGKLPEDVYWRLIHNPEIISKIRNLKV